MYIDYYVVLVEQDLGPMLIGPFVSQNAADLRRTL